MIEDAGAPGGRSGADAEPDVTAIIVTFMSAGLVDDAIRSVRAAAAAAGLALEIIVVDNASSDGTAEDVAVHHPEVVLLRNDTNVGFARANNLAFRHARGRWWLLLNPDARIDLQALGTLVEVIGDDEGLAAVGPSIRGAGMGGAESAGDLPGVRSLLGHFAGLNRLLPGEHGGPWRGWQLRARASAEARSVKWLSGAALLLRPAAITGVGGFDGSLFLYGEDLDLGDRLVRAGWRLALVPSARATHAIGGSQGAGSTGWIGGLDWYLGSRRRDVTRRLCLAIIGAGLGVRALAAAVAGGGWSTVHARRMRAGALEAARRAVGRNRTS